jgi:Tn7-like transposition protein D/TniQ protein
MICDFPCAYEGEWFYSTCARFMHHAGTPAMSTIMHELFGTHTIPGINFPRHINNFTAQLTPGHPLTSDCIIDDHTALPYFAPFIPPNRVQAIRARMCSGKAISSSRLLKHRGESRDLRFCPQCVIEARELHAECYWYLVHQLPYVAICPVHRLWLQASPVNKWTTLRHQKYVVAENVIEQLSLRPVDPDDATAMHLLNLAIDTAWLLKQKKFEFDQERLVGCYHESLYKLGFSNISSKAGTHQVMEEFKDFYSAELLKMLGCPVKDKYNPDTWPLPLLTSSGTLVVAPMQHLLLMRFLGFSPGGFFTYVGQSDKPFDSATWREPMNQSTIPEMTVRVGGMDFGPVLTDIPYSDCKLNAELNRKRKQLEALLQDNPRLNRTELFRKALGLNRWLRHNDPVWLDNHLPPRRQGGGGKVDWAARDALLTEQVRNTASILGAKDGVPKRITKGSIGILSACFWDLNYNLSRLPNTAQALNEVVETFEDFARRRALWVIEHSPRSGTPPTVRELARHANLVGHLHKDSVRNVLEEVISLSFAE